MERLTESERIKEVVKKYYSEKEGINFDDIPEFYKTQPQFTLDDIVKIIQSFQNENLIKVIRRTK